MHNKAVSYLAIKSVDEEQRELTGIASTITPDRMGDRVFPEGAKFKLPLPLIAGHNHELPLGEVISAKVLKGQGIEIVARIVKDSGLAYVEREWNKIKARLVKGLSIGFAPLEMKPNDHGGFDIKSWDWYELSPVTVPANAEATITAIKSAAQGRTLRAAATLTQTAYGPAATERKTMNLSEKIIAGQERLLAVKAALTEWEAKQEQDDYDLTDEDRDDIEGLMQEQTALAKELDFNQRLEKSIAAKVQPAVPAAPRTSGGAALAVEKQEPAGSLLAKVATAHYLAYAQQRGVHEIMREYYPEESRVQAIVKSAVGAADTTTAGWAAELVESDLRGFLDLLMPVSVYPRLAALGMRYDFGQAGSIVIPSRTSTQRLSGAFVGEDGVIPVKAGSLTSQTLNRFKMAVISVHSKELARSSRPQIEQVIRQAMASDTAEALDTVLLDSSAAVAGVRPAGLLNGVTPTASAGTTAANVITDLRTVLQPMITNNAGMTPVILMNTAQRMGLMLLTTASGEFIFRDEINGNNLIGARLIVSNTVPAGTIIGLDAADFATALGGPEFDVSDTATLTMANADTTAPTQATDGAGALGTAEQVKPDGGISVAGGADSGAATAGYQAMSMFQVWKSAIRMVLPISWGLVRSGNIAAVNSITW